LGNERPLGVKYVDEYFEGLGDLIAALPVKIQAKTVTGTIGLIGADVEVVTPQ
jgi:hypothetical protein